MLAAAHSIRITIPVIVNAVNRPRQLPYQQKIKAIGSGLLAQPAPEQVQMVLLANYDS